MSGIRLFLTIFLLIFNTFIGREKIEMSEAWKIVSLLVGILPLLVYIGFFYGIETELKKRGEKDEKGILIHMILWYALVACFAHIAGGNDNNLVIGLIFLADLSRSLWRPAVWQHTWKKPDIFWKNIRSGSRMENARGLLFL